MIAGAKTETALKFYAHLRKRVRAKLEAKATSASQHVADLEEEYDLDLSDFETELPEWFAQAAAQRLQETFAKDYWQDVNDTTRDQIETMLRTGITDGLSIPEIAKAIGEISPERAGYRAVNCARTEVGNMLNFGAVTTIKQTGEETGMDMTKMWLSVMGTTTRETHAAADQQEVPVDDLFDVGGESCRWPGDENLSAGERCNCFPAETLVAGEFVGAMRVWYKGRLTKIVTRSGGQLLVTPNHPIVTSKGLVAAGMIRPLDQLLTYTRPVNSAPARFTHSAAENVQNEYTAIGQIFDAFFDRSRKLAADFPGAVEFLPVGVADFHGDGASMQGQIDIVRTNCRLLLDMETGGLKQGNRANLVGRDGQLPNLASDCTTPFDVIGISRIAASLPHLAEPGLGDGATISDCPPTTLRIGAAAQFDASLYELTSQGRTANANFAGQLLNGFSGDVSLDDVVEISNHEFCGHVYDLQSTKGFIAAAATGSSIGIIASNCMCSIVSGFVGSELESDNVDTEGQDATIDDAEEG